MANIAVTTYCNLHCEYCFAHTMIEEMGNPIDLDQFRMILNWIARTPQNHIGLIGGEPLVHPHIDEIFKEVNFF